MARTFWQALFTSRPIRIAILILAISLILVSAAILNYWTGLYQFVAFSSPVLRVLWLPLVLLLVFVILGVVWALWRLAAVERRVSNFPEIDWAWEEATLGLRKAAVDLDRTPLILVLGEPASGIKSLFQASQMSFVVSDLPRRPNSPIRVYATREAIFVACPEASVLARLAGEGAARSPVHPRAGEGTGEGRPETPNLPISVEPTVSPGPSPAAEQMDPSPIVTTSEVLDQPGSRPEESTVPRASVLGRKEELDRIAAGLSHLCALIVRDRQPFCPANGILALIPYTATDDKSQARRAGTACHLDVTTARTALGVSCPLFTLLCNMEEAKCFERLIRAYVTKPHYSLLGRSFPLVPDLNIQERVQMIDTGMEWICQGLLAPMVYRLLQLNSISGDGDAKVLGSNTELIQFLSDTHARWQHLGRILGRVISLDPGGDLMLGGCYLAATGQSENQQGFVSGVMRTILDHQIFVVWTTESLRRDKADSRRATLCNIGFLGITAFAAVATYLFWTGTP